jgi:hypothetical protein
MEVTVKVRRTCLELALVASLAAHACGPASAPPSQPPVAAIPPSQPPVAAIPPSAPEPRLTLRPPLSSQPIVILSITPAALTVAVRTGGEPKVVETIARRPGTPPYDYATLNRALARLVRTRWPDPAKRPAETQQITISAALDTTYETVMHVMDAARAVLPGPGITDAGRVLFPDVMLGASP